MLHCSFSFFFFFLSLHLPPLTIVTSVFLAIPQTHNPLIVETLPNFSLSESPWKQYILLCSFRFEN
uniref:Secreted protein n=1 Tax=Octopus bimaculoides TaxID=37653 RepID=A0A0L8H9C0_OCTBM